MSNEETNSLNRTSGVSHDGDYAAFDNLELFAKAKSVFNYFAPELFCTPCKIVRGTDVDDRFGIEVERKLVSMNNQINKILAEFHRLDFVICNDNGSGKDKFVDFGAHTIFIDATDIDCFALAVYAYFIQLGYHVRRPHMEVNFTGFSYADHEVDGDFRHIVVTTPAFELAHPNATVEDLNWALSAPGFIRPIDRTLGHHEHFDTADAMRDYLRVHEGEAVFNLYLDHPLDFLKEYYEKRVSDYGFYFGSHPRAEGVREVFVHIPKGDMYRAACDYLGYVAELLKDCHTHLSKEPQIQADSDAKCESCVLNLQFLQAKA